MSARPAALVVITPVDDLNFVSSNLPENDHPVWVPGDPYMVGTKVIVTTGYHRIYLALTNSTGKFPPDNPLDWVEVGPTNRWSAFDIDGGTFSSGANSIEFVVTGSRLDTFAFLEMKNALRVRIRASSMAYPNYFDKTIELKDMAIVNSYWSYFNEPIGRQKNYVEFDAPCIANSTYTLTIEAEGPLSIGTFVMGKKKEIGFTEYGLTVGRRTLGRIIEDELTGRRTRIRRGVRRQIGLQLFLEPEVTDAVQSQLDDLQEVPVLFVGAPGVYECTTVVGDITRSSTTLVGPRENQLSLEIEGITG